MRHVTVTVAHAYCDLSLCRARTVLFSRSTWDKPVSYKTINKDLKTVYKECDIYITKVAHAMRHGSARHMGQSGCTYAACSIAFLRCSPSCAQPLLAHAQLLQLKHSAPFIPVTSYSSTYHMEMWCWLLGAARCSTGWAVSVLILYYWLMHATIVLLFSMLYRVDSQELVRIGRWTVETVYKSHLVLMPPRGLLAAGGRDHNLPLRQAFFHERFCIHLDPEVENILARHLFTFLPALEGVVEQVGSFAWLL